MKKITLGGMQASDIVLGCMRISDMAVSRVQELLETAVEEGINYFDHADLYGHGASEEVFAKAMGQKPSLRERIYLQSKCGIRDDGGLFRYDFSKSHILSSDLTLLHRIGPYSGQTSDISGRIDLRSTGLHITIDLNSTVYVQTAVL